MRFAWSIRFEDGGADWYVTSRKRAEFVAGLIAGATVERVKVSKTLLSR